MTPTGNRAGNYDVYTDGSNICLFCDKHGQFGHTEPKYWTLILINQLIADHEDTYH
jgi:hypothetical protein